MHEEQEDVSAKLLFVYLEPGRDQRCPGIPKRVRDDEIEQGKCNTDNKCPEEKITAEDNFVALHSSIFARNIEGVDLVEERGVISRMSTRSCHLRASPRSLSCDGRGIVGQLNDLRSPDVDARKESIWVAGDRCES